MSQLEELFQEIREQVGADFIFTDIVDKNGISLANTPAAPEPEKVKTTSAPLPPPTWRGTDFSYKPEEVEPEIKKKPDSKKSGIDNTASSIQLARVMKLSAEFCKVLMMGAVEDNLITTDKVYIISRFLGDGSYLWVLTLNRTATIGTIRMTMSAMADRLLKAISE